MELSPNQFPSGILEVCRIFHNSGFQAFVVGGSIRDLLRGENRPHDWDIATDASPSKVMKLFSQFRVIPTGLQHGTVTLLFKNLSIEITTFRVEGEYKDGRRPSGVQFVGDIKEDLARRDLTINAIAYDPISPNLVDPFNGITDLQNQIIRLVGDPDARLREDGLRLIRIFRFISQLGFSVDEKSLNAVPKHFKVFKQVAKERIEIEFHKLMSGSFWQQAIKMMYHNGLLTSYIPEFTQEYMISPIDSAYDPRFQITYTVLDTLPPEASIILRYAVLFHQLSAGTYTQDIFPDVDKRRMIEFLKRLKFPNKRIDRIIHLLTVYKNPLPYSMDDKKEKQNYALRKFLYKVDPRFLEDYLLFQKAICKVLDRPWLSDALMEDIRKRSTSQTPIYLKDLKINGTEVVSYLSIKKSVPAQREFIGICLDLLRERVEVDLSNNSKSNLYQILENVNQVKSLCTALTVPRVSIISTDHIRKLYRRNEPEYITWENIHTYRLSIWLVSCLLRRNKSNIVIFDGTNLNYPSHPFHREKLAVQFRRYNPIFINTFSTEDDLKKNIEAREHEKPSTTKSEADITIYKRYESIINRYPRSFYTPEDVKVIEISTRSTEYEERIRDLLDAIKTNNHRLIIMSGNVLTGKTFTAKKIQQKLSTLSLKK
jgi:poly(A) polymerase/tRNA nucleotidyltransferase (CCA-adding enzyme)